MKKIYTTLLWFLILHSYFCQAQPPNGDDENRVEVVKMAYITRELNLTPQEAQNFWPVYNNYQNEIKQARSQYPTSEVDFEKKVVEIKQRYQQNFKKVLGGNNQRINRVYTSDRQFNSMLRTEQNNRQQNRAQNFQQKQQQANNQPARNNAVNPNKTIKRGNGNLKRQRPPL